MTFWINSVCCPLSTIVAQHSKERRRLTQKSELSLCCQFAQFARLHYSETDPVHVCHTKFFQGAFEDFIHNYREKLRKICTFFANVCLFWGSCSFSTPYILFHKKHINYATCHCMRVQQIWDVFGALCVENTCEFAQNCCNSKIKKEFCGNTWLSEIERTKVELRRLSGCWLLLDMLLADSGSRNREIQRQGFYLFDKIHHNITHVSEIIIAMIALKKRIKTRKKRDFIA